MLDLNKEMIINKMKNYPYNKREGTLKTTGIMQIFITLITNNAKGTLFSCLLV